jgi:hypothetical protein
MERMSCLAWLMSDRETFESFDPQKFLLTGKASLKAWHGPSVLTHAGPLPGGLVPACFALVGEGYFELTPQMSQNSEASCFDCFNQKTAHTRIKKQPNQTRGIGISPSLRICLSGYETQGLHNSRSVHRTKWRNQNPPATLEQSTSHTRTGTSGFCMILQAETRMFVGFKSPWTMPHECTVCSADRTDFKTDHDLPPTVTSG